MECPNCKYVNGWNGEQKIEDEKGKFYKLPIDVERVVPYDSDRKHVWACPDCKILFFEE